MPSVLATAVVNITTNSIPFTRELANVQHQLVGIQVISDRLGGSIGRNLISPLMQIAANRGLGPAAERIGDLRREIAGYNREIAVSQRRHDALSRQLVQAIGAGAAATRI